MPVKREGITIFIFNSNTGEKGINLRKLSPEDNKLNSRDPVKILVHGWMGNYHAYWYKPMVKEYLKKGGVNVITVSWGKYSMDLNFPHVVSLLKSVAHHISIDVIELSEKYAIPFANIHLVGHSLGSHVSGFIGKEIISRKNKLIGRISALDPAYQRFQNAGPTDRICIDDASFIDVIHTAGGAAGYPTSLGHIDFYPNGGRKKQNGCASLNFWCSHKRAPMYFWESINSKNFIAVEAPNFKEFQSGRCARNRQAIMGENVDQSMRGDFYLFTNSKPPFAKGLKGIQ